MTIQRPTLVMLMVLTGAIAAGVSGCRYSRTVSAHDLDDAKDSGPVTIARMGGEIDVKDAPHGATLNTMGGDIHIGSVESFAKARTMGGTITIDHANASVDASTMGGSITVKGATGPVEASTMAGDVTVHMIESGSGRRDIQLSSKSGTITLIVPKGFGMDVRIKLAYTKSADRNFSIMDHVDLAQHESGDWDTSQGSPRKYIYAEGRVGSGENHVQIDTINGDVVLKQE